MQVPEWNKSLIEKCQIANDTYLSICNALELATLRSHGQDAAATLMFKMLRRHQLDHFLPGLRKLGIDKDPSDAVKSGKYHYFSNILGGLDVHYIEETPEKVWVRYPPPYAMSDSPFTPTVGIAAFAPESGTTLSGPGTPTTAYHSATPGSGSSSPRSPSRETPATRDISRFSTVTWNPKSVYSSAPVSEALPSTPVPPPSSPLKTGPRSAPPALFVTTPSNTLPAT